MTVKAFSHILENTRIKTRTPKQLERFAKGIANHRRIEILQLLAREPGKTLDQIAESLHCNLKTISGHTSKLMQSGLLEKKYEGQSVHHALSPLGKRFHSFLQSF